MNKVFKVLSVLSICCLSLLIAPFHISANSGLSAPFVGYNIYTYDYDTDTYITNYNVDLDDSNFKMTCSNMANNGCMTYQQTSNGDITGTISLKGASGVHNNTILKIELILDADYIGFVNLTHNGTSKNYYVNGNKIEIYTAGDGQTITINSYQLNKVSSNSLMWSFPFESYSYINYFVTHYKSQMGAFYNNNYYQFPSFNMTNGQEVGAIWLGANDHISWVFASSNNIWSEELLKQTFNFSTDIVVTKLKRFQYDLNHYTFSGITVELYSETDSALFIKANSDMEFIPIYLGYTNYPLSTEFALTFGLSNDLLDALVYGSDSSNQSSSNLDDKTNDLNQSSNQLVTQEDNFNNDMNNALQNIDTNFNVGTNFGSKFIASADWVKTQYDRLTGNTPFGSVISFSLLIGIALLLVGKVFK